MTTASLRRSSRRGLARCSLAAGVLLGALACLPVSNAWADEFIIQPFGGNSVVLENQSLAALAPVVANQSYKIITKAGAKPQSVTVSSGYSLQEIINAAGIAPGSFHYVALTTQNANATLLSAAQAMSPPTTPDFPVFFQRGQYLDFADANPMDYLSSYGLAYVYTYPGPLLSVKIKSSPSHPTAGQRVHITATVTGQAPGEALSYVWNSGTGFTYGGGYPLTQTFELPGTYYVYAFVAGSRGSVGISADMEIRVAKAPKPKRKRKGRA
jgi:hypothetical protein